MTLVTVVGGMRSWDTQTRLWSTSPDITSLLRGLCMSIAIALTPCSSSLSISRRLIGSSMLWHQKGLFFDWCSEDGAANLEPCSHPFVSRSSYPLRTYRHTFCHLRQRRRLLAPPASSPMQLHIPSMLLKCPSF
jgi:hypothetical protein